VAAAILAGDRETGASIMKVVRALDAGPVLGEVRTPIGPLDTAGELTDRIAHLGAERLAELLPPWVAGEIDAVPQDEDLMTYAPRLNKADGYVDWDQSCEAIDRLIRAFHPWPSATSTYDNQPITIHQAWPLPGLDTSEAPGTVLAGNGSDLTPLLPGRTARAVVACGRGALALLRIQRSGRQAQDIEVYLNGDRDLIGSRLGD
jgi:methionyl-tRNA formyltransferase